MKRSELVGTIVELAKDISAVSCDEVVEMLDNQQFDQVEDFAFNSAFHFDDLDALEFIMRVEDRLEIEIEEDEWWFEPKTTIRMFIDLLVNQYNIELEE